MTIFEAIVFNRELLARLDALGIRPTDAAYIDLFADFCKMVNNGDKVSYAVAVLAERYGVCERKVYTLLKRFRSPCGSAIFGGGEILASRPGARIRDLKPRCAPCAPALLRSVPLVCFSPHTFAP